MASHTASTTSTIQPSSDDVASVPSRSSSTSKLSGQGMRGDGTLPDVIADAQELSSKMSISSPSNSDDVSKRISSSSANVPSPASASQILPEEGEETPPLPDGGKRLHPLFDEDRIASEAAALSHETSSDNATAAATAVSAAKGRPNALRLLDAMPNEPGYPSPSGGFVPPVTDDAWVLKSPPASRSNAASGAAPASAPAAAESTTFHASSSAEDDEVHSRPDDDTRAGLSQTAVSQDASASASSGQQWDAECMRAMPVQARDSYGIGGPSIHRLSTSTSSNMSEGGHSQAISARSSPSTVAPVRRRSSASADVLSAANTSGHTSGIYLPPLKVRDYAYTELDPRHVGARDVGMSAAEEEADEGEDGLQGRGRMTLGLGGGGLGWRNGATDDEDDDDEEEEEEEDGDGEDGMANTSLASATPLPLGLYHAAYDFAAESEHELDVKSGQRVRLIGNVDGGWAIVVRVPEDKSDVSPQDEDVDKGLVPEAYLEWLGR